ncbi:hypothetical protein ACH5RR_026372 [Cinchona calisaya]|uniref:Helitron helicase-like domain-containing protein n=1 Tax=Cinchona calisaya TaxID=153742 RepID=A0ABD2Z5P2_9GENT
MVALFVGDEEQLRGNRDVIVEEKTMGLKRITELNPSFMAMQYPIVFPYGEDGFGVDILRNVSQNPKKASNKREFVSMREYYAYRVQNRLNEVQTSVSAGNVFQQYIVDAFVAIKENNLNWVRANQEKIKADLYKGLRDTVVREDTTLVSAGRRFVLPLTFTGGPRYMVQNYQDAMAICRFMGPPDIFITFSCNPKWSEVENGLSFIPGQKVEDRPDIVARVFKIKLDHMINDLTSGQHFGRVVANT